MTDDIKTDNKAPDAPDLGGQAGGGLRRPTMMGVAPASSGSFEDDLLKAVDNMENNARAGGLAREAVSRKVLGDDVDAISRDVDDAFDNMTTKRRDTIIGVAPQGGISSGETPRRDTLPGVAPPPETSVNQSKFVAPCPDIPKAPAVPRFDVSVMPKPAPPAIKPGKPGASV